MPSYRSNVTL